MSDESHVESAGTLINEIQLILAEKRTSLAAMRTGIAVFVLPLSVLSVLVATSEYEQSITDNEQLRQTVSSYCDRSSS